MSSQVQSIRKAATQLIQYLPQGIREQKSAELLLASQAKEPEKVQAKEPKPPCEKVEESFKDKKLTLADFNFTSKAMADVCITNCTSEEWEQIGKELAVMKSLRTLRARECNAGDAFCTGLNSSSSLQQLTLGTAHLSQRTVASETKE